MNYKKENLEDINFPIDSLGNIEVSLSQIRVERIVTRVVPRIPFPHKHDFFHIILVITGSGWHEIDFIKHQVHDGSIFILKPGQVHEWNFSPKIKGYIIEFNREAMDANIPLSTVLINQILVSKDAFVLKREELIEINCNCDKMYSEIIEKKDLYDISLQAYLTGLLVNVVRVIGKDNPNKFITKGIAENFQLLVNQFYQQQHGVDFYSKGLRVTTKALTTNLKRSRGKSPRQIIQERFLLEAKRLLSYSELSISEIAYKIGFEDPNYFSRLFRSQVKMSPAEFRQQVRTHQS